TLRRYEEALRDLDDAVYLRPDSKDPKYVFALETLGALYNALEKYDEALETLDIAIDLDPSNRW
ncbi:260_t:CDS:2, partial [Dentiscutata heterogama]